MLLVVDGYLHLGVCGIYRQSPIFSSVTKNDIQLQITCQKRNITVILSSQILFQLYSVRIGNEELA